MYEELKSHTNSKVFFYWKEIAMFSIGFIVGAMIGGFIAIALHCMVIVGKEEDKKWEEEQITKKITTRNIQKISTKS